MATSDDLLLACIDSNNGIINKLLGDGVVPTYECLITLCSNINYTTINTIKRIISMNINPDLKCLKALCDNRIGPGEDSCILDFLGRGIIPDKECVIKYIKNYSNDWLYHNNNNLTLKMLAFVSLDIDILRTLCIQFYNLKHIKYVISMGIKPDIICLQNACCTNNMETVELLINHGIKPDDTCLMNALKSNNSYYKDNNIVIYLVENCGCVLIYDHLIACFENKQPNLYIINYILDSKLVTPDIRCLTLVCNLPYASNDITYIIKKMISMQVIPDAECLKGILKYRGRHISNAYIRGLKDTITLLLDNGAIPDVECVELLLTNEKYSPIVELLLKSINDLTDDTLEKACNYNSYMVINKLIKYGLKSNITCIKNNLNSCDNIKIFKLLIKKLQLDDECLEIACKNGRNTDIINMILKNGIMPNNECINGAITSTDDTSIDTLIILYDIIQNNKMVELYPTLETLKLVCANGKPKIALRLLEFGLEPNTDCFKLLCDATL